MKNEYVVADETMLRGHRVAVTLSGMKTEQVRIPVDLAEDGRIVAATLGISLPEYVTQVVRAAVLRDLPKAAKEAARRAKKASGKEETE